MRKADIENLAAAAFGKTTLDHLADPWETHHARIRKEQAGRRELLARPDIGWLIARNLVADNSPPDTLAKPECRWVRAAMAVIAGGKGDGADLEAVAEARDLHETPGSRVLIRAALLARDATAESVAGALNLPVPVVEAYDALFFRVLDRKADIAYLQNAVRVALARRGFAYMAATADPRHEALFGAALKGTLEDVLDLTGSGEAADKPSEAAAERLMKDILAAGSEWMAANRGSGATPPPLVVRALDCAQRIAGRPLEETGKYPQSTGEFARLAGASLEEAAHVMRADFEDKIAGRDPGNAKPVPAASTGGTAAGEWRDCAIRLSEGGRRERTLVVLESGINLAFPKPGKSVGHA